MLSDQTSRKIERLRDEINRHNYLYYVKNKPEISDREFDSLLEELHRLESEHPELVTPDSPTQKVGGEPVDGFSSVRHPTPMFSMDNTYNEEELKGFDNRVWKRLTETNAGEPSYVLEPKVDGVAINLIYRNGALERAITRGNGRQGDEVTHNARTLVGLPLSLYTGEPDTPDSLDGTLLEIRGEVYMPFSSFRDINSLRKKNGDDPFANPRNATAGTLKLLDPSVTAGRKLHIFTYEIGQHEGLELPDSHARALSLLGKLGCPVNPDIDKCMDIEAVLELCTRWEGVRDDLDYPVDGLVIKVESRRQREVLGHTTKAPRYMIAYKFGADRAVSVVQDIRIQVGKSGRQTPVADLEPVSLSGSVVSRASLHNFDELRRKDIRIGDKVSVEKAGEIIPQVINVHKEFRSGNERELPAPVNCASCGEKLEKEPDGVYISCINPRCPAQVQERIEHFGSSGAMDIEGLGPAVVKQLLERDLIADCADLYVLQKDDIARLERLERKSAQNLTEAIEKSKGRGLSRLLYALGIPHTGSHLADVLAARFRSIDELMQAAEEELESIDEVGPVVANSIRKFFDKESTLHIIDKLKRYGVKTESDVAAEPEERPFSGKRFVITGTLKNYTRRDISAAIEKLGGRVTSDVSSSTDYLVAGEAPGGKLDRARREGVEIIGEEEFERMCEG